MNHPQIRAFAPPNILNPLDLSTDSLSTQSLMRLAVMGVSVFVAAILVRLGVMQFFTGTDASSLGWFMDTFHHWQIAFLSKGIGFENGFLRLWDFKGMEYFWGLMQPLILTGLFAAFKSIDLMVLRLLTVVTGSLTAVFFFILTKRYFGLAAALGTAMFAAVNPVIALADTSGLQEPLGVMFLLLALLLWQKHPIPAGIVLGIAGMVRAEYWVFGGLLAVAAILVERRKYAGLSMLLGWAIPTILYMNYMYQHTGNPIYPIYWYFFGDAVGYWMGEGALTPEVIAAMWISRISLPFLAAVAIWILKRRPRSALLLLFGIGELIFLAIVFGFTAFGRGFTTTLLIDRIFLIPHLYIGFFISVVLLWWIPSRVGPRLTLPIGVTALAGMVFAIQLFWLPIQDTYLPRRAAWEQQFQAADEIAYFYEGGVVSIPENAPEITYILAREYEIPAKLIDGQMYDPFSRFEGDPFTSWSQTETALIEWLEGRDIRLIAYYAEKETYQEMVRRMPDRFEYLGSALNGRIDILRVNVLAPPPKLDILMDEPYG